MTRPLYLTDAERVTLTELRDHGPKPYLRERAAALLKIADGLAPTRIARSGLLRPRRPETVMAWLDRYTIDGIAGLQIQPGRGRKPAFSPSGPSGRG